MSGKMHGGGGAAADESTPRPTLAEVARTLAHLGRVGTLATLSRKRPGFPFGSVMPYAVDHQGRPIFLISSMAMHTRNIAGDARVSLLIMQEGVQGDPLGAGRVTLVGNCVRLAGDDAEDARRLYLERHPNARHWVEYADFSFYRLAPLDVYVVGGFGVMGWVSAQDYRGAAPDPLAEAAPGIIDHMNEDHADALALLAREFGGVDAEEAEMTAVDRLGFNVKAKTPDGYRGVRLAFPFAATSPDLTRQAMVEMVRLAREKNP